MAPWEANWQSLIKLSADKLPSELTEEQLVELRTYIGRELTNRTLKEKASG